MAVLAMTTPGLSQTPSTVITGIILDDTDEPVPAADIIITPTDDGESSRTFSDAAGRFRIVFTKPSPGYIVRVRAVGWQTLTKRVARAGAANAPQHLRLVLEPAPIGLDGIDVVGERPRPGISPVVATRALEGTTEHKVEGVPAGLSPELQGDIAALAGNIPGATTHEGGVSILGIAPEQNETTLGGMAFSGERVPKGTLLQASVATTPFDPARGGFSGAEITLDVVPGRMFTVRNADIAITASPDNDGVPAVPYHSIQLGANGRGPLLGNAHFYSAAVEASRLGANEDRAATAPGAQLRAVLNALGISSNAAALDYTAETLTFLGRADIRPGSTRAYGDVVAYVDLSHESGFTLRPGQMPSTGDERSALRASLMGHLVAFVHGSFLNELRAGISFNSNMIAPLSELPRGQVEVEPAGDGGASSASLFTFGGQGNTKTSHNTLLAQASNLLQWHDMQGRHLFQLYLESQYEDVSQPSGVDGHGLFTYASIDDLALNRPRSYSRTLRSPEAYARQLRAAISLADSWRSSRNLSILYGLRLDANTFPLDAAANDSLLVALGLDTRALPAGWGLSPRFGFNWLLSRTRSRTWYYQGSLGEYTQGLTGVLSGGVGVFRNVIRSDYVANIMGRSGAATGVQQIRCIGPAVPAADWSAFANDPRSIPTDCAGGPSSVWLVSTPDVAAFASDYEPERAVRASLAWQSRIKSIFYGVEAVYSRSLVQRSVVDVNLLDAAAHQLANESARPLFAAPSTIFAGTGAISLAPSRKVKDFGHAFEQRSDMSASATRLIVTVRPDFHAHNNMFVNGAYAYAHVREQARGFDAATAGDPRQPEWSAGRYEVPHQFQLQAGVNLRPFTVSAFGVLESGLPFTPMVRGDINGDGLYNDRAFIFDPEMNDGAVSGDMNEMLASVPARVRSCVTEQAGRVAARNSCRGNWSKTLNLRVDWRPRGGRLSRSVWTLSVANPIPSLREVSDPDNVLYIVRGFDADRSRFIYTVNSQFGQQRLGGAVGKRAFRISLEAKLNLGATLPEQQIARYGPARDGARLSLDSLRLIYTRLIPDPYLPLLMQSDSLRLEPAQVQSIRDLRFTFLKRVDSLATRFAVVLVQSTYDVPRSQLLARQTAFTNAAYLVLWDQREKIIQLLSRWQYEMAPRWLRSVFSMSRPPREGDIVMP